MLAGLDTDRTHVLCLGILRKRDRRSYNLAYYARNRDAEIARVITRQQSTLAWLRELRQVPCMDCGRVFPPHVMDFDHRDPKTKSFGLASSHALLRSRGQLLAEIAKCDIVCANCHAIRTAAAYEHGLLEYGFRLAATPHRNRTAQGRRERFRRHRAAQNELLDRIRQLPCTDCGGTFPIVVMQFDHRDPSKKHQMLSQMAGRVRIATLLEEIAKCDIVCTNCHRDRSFRRRSAYAGVAQLVEREFSKLDVAGSSPVSRSVIEQLRLIEESATPFHDAA